MGKKKLIIIVASILVVVAIGLGVGLGIANANKIWYKAHCSEGVGAVSLYSELVKSYEDLPYNIGDEYDEEYFTKKAVIIITHYDLGNYYKRSVEKVYKKDGVLYVDVAVKLKEGVTGDWHWEILVEVMQSDIKDVTRVKEINRYYGYN